MTITDKQVLKMLKKVDFPELDEDIEGYPDDERDGRSDIEFFADEVSYMVSCYEEDGHRWNDDLTYARRILRETKNGKVRKLDLRTFYPIREHSDASIEQSRNEVNAYNRLKRLSKKLAGMGYYGSW